MTIYQSAQKEKLTWLSFAFLEFRCDSEKRKPTHFSSRVGRETLSYHRQAVFPQEDAAVLQAATAGCYTHAVYVLQHLAGLRYVWGVGHGHDHRRPCPSEGPDGGRFNHVGVRGRPWTPHRHKSAEATRSGWHLLSKLEIATLFFCFLFFWTFSRRKKNFRGPSNPEMGKHIDRCMQCFGDPAHTQQKCIMGYVEKLIFTSYMSLKPQNIWIEKLKQMMKYSYFRTYLVFI